MGAPILLTGFEPFHTFLVNSSWEAAKVVAAREPNWVRAELLPVDYRPAQERLYTLLEEHRPEVCLCTGLCDQPWFRMERLGRRPPQLAHLEGPEVLEGEWPWAEMEGRLLTCGREVRTSHDAGRYVCDSTYWALLAFRLRHGYPRYAAFLHVPPVSDLFPVELTAEAVRRVLEVRWSYVRHGVQIGPRGPTAPGTWATQTRPRE